MDILFWLKSFVCIRDRCGVKSNGFENIENNTSCMKMIQGVFEKSEWIQNIEKYK
jgi:hypothetical protein